MKHFIHILSTCCKQRWRSLLLLGLVALSAHAQDNADARFDIDVVDSPARAFFTGLVAGTPHNLLVHPQVSGTITLSLKRVTVVDVLQAAKDLYGYDFRKVASGYMVLPATVQSRIFYVSYLDVVRSGISRTRVSSGQLTQGGNQQYGSGSNGSGSNGSGNQNQSNENSKEPSREGAGTSVLTHQEADFWKTLETSLRAIVGTAAGRNVVMNPQSGVVLVQGSPTELRDVSDYLQKTEQAMGRQVVLEAKIVEVELKDAFQAGINWAAMFNRGGSNYAFGTTAPPMGFDNNLTQQQPVNGVMVPGNPITGLPATALGGAFTLAADFTDFTTFIELLGAQGNTRVLSSPRVSTLNNQKAVIKAGSDEFFVTSVQSNTVTGTASSTSRNIEFTPFFSGVALDVTPQVNDNNQVILHIHPSVSEVVDKAKNVTISGSTDSIPLAFSQIRESDSVVKANNGQLIVIGGLMREIRERQHYKVPGLGSIPLLGRLFRSERDVTRTVELVILLRPLVVGDGDNEWDKLIKEPNDRVNELEQRGKLQEKQQWLD